VRNASCAPYRAKTIDACRTRSRKDARPPLSRRLRRGENKQLAEPTLHVRDRSRPIDQDPPQRRSPPPAHELEWSVTPTAIDHCNGMGSGLSAALRRRGLRSLTSPPSEVRVILNDFRPFILRWMDG
jgi:hypothetical protein